MWIRYNFADEWGETKRSGYTWTSTKPDGKVSVDADAQRGEEGQGTERRKTAEPKNSVAAIPEGDVR